MRTKKAVLNIITSLLQQLAIIICGLIVPRLVIEVFGSEVNGAVNSISQFLGYIVLAEAGVGGVVRAALYKPLADGDTAKISSIMRSTEKFFRTIGLIFIGYTFIIAFSYKAISDFRALNGISTFFLVLVVAASSLMQYFYGMAYSCLLQADQRGYISATLQTVTLILNAVAVVVLIKLGAGIITVKLISAYIHILRPVFLWMYVRRRYRLDKDAKPDDSAIKQRWDGLGHHIAFFLHTNTDIVVLTVFAGLVEVSVYSVYYMISQGLRMLTASFSGGLEAAFGNILAKKEKENLRRSFSELELLISSITVVLFTSAGLLIVPFVRIYTLAVTDADYIRPAFAAVLLLADAAYCIRLPYNAVVLAAGHYRETRNGAFVEAGINIALSLILVKPFGVMGVAIGTLAAMAWRTVDYAVYLSKNILRRKLSAFIRRQAVSLISSGIIILAVRLAMPVIEPETYLSWAGFGIAVFLISSAVTAGISFLFYKKDTVGLLKRGASLLKIQQ